MVSIRSFMRPLNTNNLFKTLKRLLNYFNKNIEIHFFPFNSSIISIIYLAQSSLVLQHSRWPPSINRFLKFMSRLWGTLSIFMSIVDYMIFARIDLGFFRLRDFKRFSVGGDEVNLFNPVFKVIWVYPETHVHNLPFILFTKIE